MPNTTPIESLFKDPEFIDAFTTMLLPEYMPLQRWFTSKGKSITQCTIENFYSVLDDAGIALVRVSFADGSQELYQMPLALNSSREQRALYQENHPGLILGEITGTGMIADAVARADFRNRLYEMVRSERETASGLNCEAGRVLKEGSATASSVVPSIDTSNTAIIFNNSFFFKLFRKLDPGLNPDLELVRFLSEQTGFRHSPPYGGSLGIGQMEDDDYLNLAMMSGKVDNLGDAWQLFQQLTEQYFAGDGDIDDETLRRARLLGIRTAEMHKALASAGPDRPDLVPEEMTPAYRSEITEAAQRLLKRQFAQLAEGLVNLPPTTQQLARRVLGAHEQLNELLSTLKNRDMEAKLTRIHGDYHLGQVLYTAGDFYIIDFEGEPLLTIPERRRKRPPLKDVGGMVRSFHYAAQGQLLLNPKRYADQDLSERAEYWYSEVSAAYLDAYFKECGDADFLPASHEDRRALLDLFILEKAVYEVAYELNSRPDWLPIPLGGVLSLV